MRAQSADSGIIIKPEVSRSNLFTAEIIYQKSGQKFGSPTERTKYFLISQLANKYLDETVLVISPRCMDRLEWKVIYNRCVSDGRTNNAAWFINDNEFSFYIMVEDFDTLRRDWRLMAVDDVSVE